MPSPQALLERLDAIGASIERSGKGVALIGLGSVGIEQTRLDEFSDLDFFAIVQPGTREGFLKDLGWLSNIASVAYSFQNTRDGFKLLYEDGIFCEFAVFEPQELSTIPFAEGRIVWKAPGVPDDIRKPVLPNPKFEQRSTEYLIGEAITCLFVGLGRFHRGEKLSAQRFVQSFAVDRVLELAPLVGKPTGALADVFANERRFEARFPEVARKLPAFVQGYERTPQSALAILEFLERHFTVNAAVAANIRGLCTLGARGSETPMP